MRVEKDYEELLKLLNKHKVKYCVVGGYAVAFYGRPRYTKDIDILIEPVIENAKKIIAALNEFGFESVKLCQEDLINIKKISGRKQDKVDIEILSRL